MKRIWMAVAVAVAGVGLADAADDAALRTVSVSGQGERLVEPEFAELTCSVEVVRPEPAAAKTEADAVFGRLMAVLARHEIKKEDISTSRLFLSAKYEFENNSHVFKGYEVTRRATVTVRELERLETLLQQVIESGVNNVGDIELRHGRQAELEGEALKSACAQAREKAAFLAGQFNASLGAVRTIRHRNAKSGEWIAMGGADPFSPAPARGSTFEFGRITLRSDVEVTFDIVPK